jgi:hypothetical protein
MIVYEIAGRYWKNFEKLVCHSRQMLMRSNAHVSGRRNIPHSLLMNLLHQVTVVAKVLGE